MESFLDDAEIVSDFATEATERLDIMADLALEAEEGSPEALRGLRGELHSLKGAAGFLGLDGFSELCHDLEEYLLREQASGQGERFDLLHEVCDVLREWVVRVQDACGSGAPPQDDPRGRELRARLRPAA